MTDDGAPFRLEYRVEGRWEFGVTVVHQEAHRHGPVLEQPTDVARFTRRVSGHPGCPRPSRGTYHLYPSTAKLNEQQHVQRFQPRRLDGEEGTRQQRLTVVAEERPSTTPAVASFGCWRDAVSFKDIPDGRTADVVAELAQLPLELAIAPGRVLLGQPQDQRFEFGAEGWSTACLVPAAPLTRPTSRRWQRPGGHRRTFAGRGPHPRRPRPAKVPPQEEACCGGRTDPVAALGTGRDDAGAPLGR